MAKLPSNPESATVQAITASWAKRNDPPRPYLGASVIGRECERQLWYAFRWAAPEQFDGRMLRLFDRGQREEAALVADLRAIGCEVYDTDPSTGKQFTFTAIAGHSGGSMDAVARGIPEAPKAWHVCEFKTHSAKSFADLTAKGVQGAKPEHYAQMMLYMHWAQLDRALYLAVNKDTDALYSERVRYDETQALALVAKAERVIYAAEPLPRLSDDPAFFKCKFCPASAECHGTPLPAVSCRTCLHATPEREGNGRWSCAKYSADIPLDAQRTGCDSHLYIPALLARWGEATDASEADGWVEYRAADGFTFRNGPWGVGTFTSRELHAVKSPAVIRDGQIAGIRAQIQATLIDGEAAAA